MLDLIIQTAPDAIVTVDADGLVLSFSPAAERMFGYAAEEVIGRNVSLLMPEPHARRHDDHMRRYLETGEKRVIGIGRKVRARRRDGTVFPAEIAVGELAHGDRHVFTGFVRDIGDQEAAERRAAQLQRLLDQASRLQNLGEISSAISHEVSQPLSAVTTFARAAARLLDGGAPDVAAARGHLDRVAQEAQRAAEILKRMRRLVERGAGDLRPEDLNALVQEAVALSGVAAEHGDVAVRLELAEDLPPVLADRVQIQQVIVNLLINAVEAIAGEPGELRVI
ncbi:MAG: PAS domain S-box protein, partial [Pseudomonadota bacterium]